MAYILGLLIALPILALCVVLIFVLLKAPKKSQEAPLTPRDLQVLQESAEEIVNSITSAAEESMRRFEEASSRLEDLIIRAEKAAQFLEARLGPPVQRTNESTGKLDEAVKLAQSGLDKSDIARHLNMGAGEVELLLNLRPRSAA